MLWWRKKRPRRPSGRPDTYERPKGPVRPMPVRTPEDNVGALNYQPDEPEQNAGEIARGAWTVTVVIAATFALALIIGLFILFGTQVRSAWQGWQGAPLQRAAAAGDMEEVQRLIDGGADPNRAGSDGETPLIAALRTDRPQATAALLAAGAEPSHDAIDVAVRYERRDGLIAMIEAGGDPDTRNSWSTKSLLEIATEQSDAGLVKLLLEHGADPDVAPDESPFTTPALFIAAANNEAEIALLLLDYGADPTLRRAGWTAVETARNAGNEELARILLEAAQEE